MKVLFIGFGSIARKHFNAIRTLYSGVEFYALRSNEDAEPLEGIINLFSWGNLPEGLTFAVISSPTFKHVDDLREVIEREIPIFLEKPISDTLKGLKELNDLICKKQIVTYVACNLRFLPVLKFLRENVPGKRINEILIYAGSYLPDWRPHSDFRASYSAHADMGGGVHLDLFHELDYICWIFGFPTKTFSTRRNVSSISIDSMDFASYHLIYPEYTALAVLNYYRKVPKRSIEIVFDQEVWTVDLLTNRIEDGRKCVVFEDKHYTILNTYIDQMNYFVKEVLQRPTPLMNSFAESLEILKICLTPDETI